MSLAEHPSARVQARQLWAERLQRFAESGATVAAFCQSQSVSVQTFYYWKRKLRHHAPDAPQPRLLPVRLKDASAVELVLPNGCVLRLPPGCDLDFVGRLVTSLGAEPC